MAKIPGLGQMSAMMKLAPKKLPATLSITKPGIKPATGKRRHRVAILSGCAQSVLDPDINSATIELLTRFGVEVVVPKDETCCGSLVHHMGHEEAAHRFACQNIDAWMKEIDGLDAIIITASGCGTTVKDYGHMLRNSKTHAKKAARISALTKDITEFLHGIDLPQIDKNQNTTIAYHSACSMQHGQKITDIPKNLLKNAGFDVKGIPEGHLCCGSAGIYNIMQAQIADQLKTRKIRNIELVKPDFIATGNIGCITQIASGTDIPILHTVEILNWAYGGQKPEKLS
jgi:glycolate oxidase iron-sulfur subunit